MILCLVEPGELSLEALAFAQRLGPVQAFSVEAGEAYAPGAWAAAIVQLVDKHSPDAVVAAGERERSVCNTRNCVCESS